MALQINNCENCKFFVVQPQYSTSGEVNYRQGHCQNKRSGWFNMPIMDVYTCGNQEMKVVNTTVEEPRINSGNQR